jgi:hypothetical protein
MTRKHELKRMVKVLWEVMNMMETYNSKPGTRSRQLPNRPVSHDGATIVPIIGRRGPVITRRRGGKDVDPHRVLALT